MIYFLRFLNKAAIIEEDELKPDGTCVNQWRLCSIQQVEEVKCLIRIIPIWAAGIISLTSIIQQGTFTVSQALKMDRHLGPHFQIPAGSIGVISLITIGLWLPFYDRFIVPALRKITKHEGGITLLQRIGIGIIFSILSMVVAGLIERERRASAILHPQPLGVAPMSVMWLAPQLILMGFCEAFNIIGQIEFFNRQFPEHMRSIGNALFSCSFAGASYLSSLLVTIVHHVTKKHGRPDWLTNDINVGRLDYFYFLIAGMGVLNMIYFIYCARQYCYRGSSLQKEDKPYVDVELSSIKAWIMWFYNKITYVALLWDFLYYFSCNPSWEICLGLLLIYGHCCNKKSMVRAIYIYAPLSMVRFLPWLFVVTFAKMQKGFKNCSWSVCSMCGMKWSRVTNFWKPQNLSNGKVAKSI